MFYYKVYINIDFRTVPSQGYLASCTPWYTLSQFVCSVHTSSGLSVVMFTLTPSGHLICNTSLLSCSRNMTRTKRAFTMKNASTARSLRSFSFFASSFSFCKTRIVYISQPATHRHFVCNNLQEIYVMGCDAFYYDRDRSQSYDTCARRQFAYGLEWSHAKGVSRQRI